MTRIAIATITLVAVTLGAAALGMDSRAAAVPAPGVAWATDALDESGITFVHAGYHAGSGRDSSAFYEATAGGACVADYDRDGYLDILITDFIDPEGRGGSRLYRGMGLARFEDVTEAQGIVARGVGHGCAWGDYDNDGWPDVFVAQAITDHAPFTSLLFRNLGHDQGFEDVTAHARVTGDATHPGTTAPCRPTLLFPDGSDIPRCWTVAGAWIDHDLDGDLDLYVTNYAEFGSGSCLAEFQANPIFCTGQSNRLYVNNGDGTFTDDGARLGVADNGQGTRGRSLAVIATDIDGDAWPDLYVANDKDANALYLNNRDGTFRNVAAVLGVDNHGLIAGGKLDHRAGMGVAAADWNNDGRIDLASSHLKAEYDGIYLNTGDGFDDVARDIGFNDTVALDVSRWGIGFHDLDLDGWLDAVIVAGGQARSEPGPVHLLMQREGRFVHQAGEAWPFYSEGKANHRQAAFGDFDNDGDMDVMITALPSSSGVVAKPKLLLFHVANESAGSAHRWLRVSLEGTDNARDAFGARVTVTLADGRMLTRTKASGGSYLGNEDPRLHFGLGNATRGSITVTWPAGLLSEPVVFDLRDRPGEAIHIVEANARAPPPMRWADAPVEWRDDGTMVLRWRGTFGTDVVGYRIDQAPDDGFAGDATTTHEVTGRDTTILPLADRSAGSRFRIRAVDAGGLVGEPSAILDADAAGDEVPGAGTVLVVGALALVAMTARAIGHTPQPEWRGRRKRGP